MPETTVLSLGRTVKKYIRTVHPIKCCTSLIHRFHDRCKSESQPALLKSVFKRWQTDVTPEKDGIGLRSCRLDSLLLQNFMEYQNTSYAAVYLLAKEAQIGKAHPHSYPVEPINIYHFPLMPLRFCDRKIYILKSEPNPKPKIDASPRKEPKDNSIRVIREVTTSFPALDTDFLRYLEGQNVQRIQNEAVKLEESNAKPDVDKKNEITASDKNDRKDDQKSGKKFKKKDKKKKSRKYMGKLEAEFAEIQKRLNSQMSMAKKWAEKKKKFMEEAKNAEKAVATKPRRSPEKTQFLVAELRVMQEACKEVAEKIKRVKEAKRQELIKVCQGLIEEYLCLQLAKENQRRA